MIIPLVTALPLIVSMAIRSGFTQQQLRSSLLQIAEKPGQPIGLDAAEPWRDVAKYVTFLSLVTDLINAVRTAELDQAVETCGSMSGKAPFSAGHFTLSSSSIFSDFT